MPFHFIPQKIKGIQLIKPDVYFDERGHFLEFFKKSVFIKNNIKEDFLQDNFSFSNKGVIRGLHYQIDPHSQGKLVLCLRGKIFDVAVDIRKNSPTFGKWISFELSEENKNFVYLPPGIAHGFESLTEKTLVMYKTTKEYHPKADKGILLSDKTLNINWRNQLNPIISEKDRNHKAFKDCFDI